MSLECTTEDCGNGTSTYLCSQCVKDLQAWIDLAHGYAVDLNVTIARQDVLRRAGSPGGGGAASESAMPWNDDADQLQQNLYSIDRDAKDYAKMEDAAGQAWMIQEWCQKAERLISGPEPERVDTAAARARLEAQVPPNPMPTSDLKKWLHITHGIVITGDQLRQWVHRKKLQRANEEGRPTYYPAVVLAVAKAQEHAIKQS